MSPSSARLVRRVAAGLALVLVVTVGSISQGLALANAAPAVAPAAASAAPQTAPQVGPPAQQAAAAALAQDFTLATSASPTSLPYQGGSVTYTFTLTNTGTDRLYFQSGVDTECPTVAYVSGGSTSGVDNTRVFDAGQTLVFRCTTNVTATTTSTATFVFGFGSFCNAQCDGTLTRSASTTISVQQPLFACDTTWYTSVNGADNTGGSYGYLRPSVVKSGALAPAGLTGNNNSSASAIDPTNPNYLYYAPRNTAAGTFSNTLYRVDLASKTQTLVATGTSANEFATNRLAFDPTGTVWVLNNAGAIHSWSSAAGFSAAKTATTSNAQSFATLQSGDIAFDGLGTMWILAASATTTYLYTISAAQLATSAPAATLVGTVTPPGTGGFFNGLAFGADGTLYASANSGTNPPTSYLYSINKDTGASAQLTSSTAIGLIADLGSCALPKPALRVQKTVSPATAVKGGETLTYTIKTDNIGTLSATGATLQDAIPANTTYVKGSTTRNGTAVADTGAAPFFPYAATSPVNGTGANAGVIPAGGSATVTFKVTVNTLTTSVRSVCNQGTVTFTGGSAVLSDDPNVAGSGDPTCNLAYTPGVQVTKTASPTTVNGSGPVTYSYAVINQGNEPLKTVLVSDDKGTLAQTHTGDTNGDGLLQLGETWVYTLTQTLTTTTTNTATVSAAGNVSGASASGTSQATVTVLKPSLNLSKVAGGVTGPEGDGTYRQSYTVRVANTGTGAGSYGPISDAPAFASNLTPTGATWSGQATGTASGAGPYPIGAAGTPIAAGDTHTYTVVVAFRYTNGTAATSCTGSGTGLFNAASLPAGQEQGVAADNSACASPPAPPAPALTLTKSAGALQDLDGNGADAGDRITYTFTVRNSGNVNLTGVALTDPRLAATALTCPATTLAVGASFTCTAVDYTVTQADVDAGAVNNTASVTGTAANGVAASGTSSTTTALPVAARLTLTKSVADVADVNANGVTDAGDRIRYAFSVTNNGNVSLSSVTVTDSKLGLANAACSTGTLAPGASATCTASPVYTVTAADVTAGTVQNSATASATTAAGGTTTSAVSTTSTPVATSAALNVSKTAGAVSAVDPETGQYTVTYSVQVSNSGQTPTAYGALSDRPGFASGLVVDSASWTGQTTGSAPGTGPYTLAPAGTTIGGSTTQTWSLTVRFHYSTTTQAAACAGTTGSGLSNAASLPAGQESGASTDNTACAAPPAPPSASIALTKSVAGVQDVNGNGLTDTGDRITYAFTVRNTGNIAVNATSVTDTRLGGAGITITCADPNLSVGESTACTASGPYPITSADVTAGAVNNTATASGTPPGLPAVTATDSTSVPTQTASLALTKAVGAISDVDGNGVDVGDTVVYTFSIRNTGTTALSDLRITDAKLGQSAAVCATGPLAAGATTSCTRTYTLTQADVDLGRVDNTATATGTPPGGATPVSGTAQATLPVAQRNAMTLTKSASSIADVDGDGRASVGDTITYTFSVLDTGTTSLTDARVTDPKLGLSSAACASGPILPGAGASCSSAVVYRITQADIDAGAVTNTASSTATPPGGSAPTSTSSTTTPITAVARITLDKVAGPVVDANGDGHQDAGDRVTYTLGVTNTSNVTLTDVTVTDAMLGPVSCPRTTLTPGQSTVCTATAHTLTQTEVDSGRIDNTASVSAAPPTGARVTASDTETVTLTPVNAVALVKSAGPVIDTDGNGPDPGDTISYSFTLTNTGAQSLTRLAVTDTKLGLSGYVCATGPLAPGATATCSSPSPYVLTQADVDAGAVDNTASVSASPPTGPPVTASSTARRTFAPVSAVSLRKIAGAVVDLDGNGQDVGDQVTYTFEVTNSGATTLRDGVVIDTKLGLPSFTCAPGAIAPGQTVTCTAPQPYTLTQADVDAGGVSNTATSTATTPGGGSTQPATGSATRPVTPTNGIELTKTASGVTDVDGNGPDAGDTIAYTFAVRNTGGSTLTDIRISDPRLGMSGLLCAAGPLTPGATLACEAPRAYTLTQADVNAGQVVNTATATATPAAGAAPSDDASAVRSIDQIAQIAIVKSAGPVVDANGSGRTDAGDTVTYTFTVRNTANVSITGIRVSDAHLGLNAVQCGQDTLDPGQSTTCTFPAYTVTQAEIDAQRVENSARVTGQVPGGAVVSGTDLAVVDVTPVSSVALTKSPGPVVDTNGNGRQDAGDQVRYTFSVRNTGATSLTDIRIADAKLGLSAYPCAAGPLAPGDTATCTSPAYTLTQADANAGRIDNTATSTASTPPGGTASADASATLTLTATNAIALTKTASAIIDLDGNGADAGDTITYAFSVQNTGTTTLTDIRLDDGKLGLANVGCSAGPLAPGASTDCASTKSYTLTQADVDSGAVSNTATTHATPSSGTAPSGTSSTMTPLTNLASIALTKAAGPVVDANGDGFQSAGDTVAYTFTVRNVSNVTLGNVVVSDPRLASVTCAATTLAPGASTTCAAPVFVLTQADLDAGTVVNTASASATDPQSRAATASSSATVTLTPRATLALRKAAGALVDANGNGRVDAGDTLTYSFAVTNTGSVTVRNVVVTDSKLGLTNYLCAAGPVGPGATVSCSPPAHVVTQGEIDAGKVDNSASAVATTPSGGTTTPPGTDSLSTPLAPLTSVALRKASSAVTDVNGDGRVTPGDTIAYTFTATNTGATTLRDVRIADTRLGLATFLCATGPVAPGLAVTCSAPASYAVTQSDIDAGRVDNTASLSAAPQTGSRVTATASTTTPLQQVAALSLTKDAGAIVDTNNSGRQDVGDTITYTFTVKNTSNVTLTNVAVADSKLGTVTCPTTTIPALGSITCTATPWTILQAEVNSGRVDNAASATATSPTGPVSATANTSVPVERVFSQTFTKAAGSLVDVDRSGSANAGDTLTYTFTVTNTGNAGLRSVTVDDAKLGLRGYSCGTGPLAPGATRVCTSPPYALSQADVDLGRVDNTATGRALGTDASPVSAAADATVNIPVSGGIELTKQVSPITDANADGRVGAGDTVTYTFTLANASTVTLSGITLSDPRLGLSGSTCGAATLAPRASTTCTRTYALSQADVDGHVLANTATATATTARGATVGDESSASVTAAGSDALELTKTASAITDVDGNGVDAGDTITYTFSVRNTGTTSLRDVTLNDAKVGLAAAPCLAGPLAPGATAVCATTSTYPLTQADVDSGAVANSATATAVPPYGTAPTSTSSTRTPVTSIAAIALDKVAGPVADSNRSGRQDAGDTLAYTLTVTNTSAVTLTGVAVTDPALGPVTCPATRLAPGESTTCTAAAYLLTQADLDAGRVDNTATVTAQSPTGTDVTAVATATVTLTGPSSLTLAKVAGEVVDTNGDRQQSAGDTVTYAFTVTNTGARTLTGASVSDGRIGVSGLACGSASLAPGRTVSCSAAYVLSQADIDAGRVDNTATATGTDPQGSAVSGTGTAARTLTGTNAIELTKSASAITDTDGNGADAGDTVDYTFSVRNTGSTTLTNARVSDPKLGLADVLCVAGPLAPGRSLPCSTTRVYVLTQADIDAGAVNNTATTTATAPNGTAPTGAASASVSVDTVGAIALDKQSGAVADANGSGHQDAGDTITYTFTITNTSNVTLAAVGVDDNRLAWAGRQCGQGTLGARGTTTCTGTYTLTQADIDAGRVDNSASVGATEPRGNRVSDRATATVLLTAPASVELTKTAGAVVDANGTGRQDAGDTVTYGFSVRNTGATSLGDLRLNDARVGLSGVLCASGPLAPGQSVACASTATYPLGQPDVDAGSFANTAEVVATSAAGGTVNHTASATVSVQPTSSLTITKSASAVLDVNGNGPSSGDEVRYTFAITNTGATTISGVTVDDPKLGLTRLVCAVSLPPRASVSCEPPKPYLLTQADVDAGFVNNTATATGRAPGGSPVTGAGSARVDVTNLASIVLDKVPAPPTTAQGSDPDHTDAGDTVSYTLTVHNTSNVTLRNVVVADPKAGRVSCPAATVGPGAGLVCTAGPYTLTQGDVDQGWVDNTASVRADSVNGSVTASDIATVAIAQTSSLQLVKSAGPVVDANGSGRPDAGDTVTYRFAVTNTGTTTLTNPRIDDPALGLNGLACGATPLAPGQASECTSPARVLNQADIDRGHVDNTATATATGPNGSTTNGAASVRVSITPVPVLDLTKSAGPVVDANGSGRQDAGDTVLYSFTVANAGTVTLAGVQVVDELLGQTALVCGGTVPPGQTATCSGRYTLTQADIDGGRVDNRARASGTAPDGTGVTGVASASVPLTPTNGLRLTKTASAINDIDGNGADAGDTITYSFSLTNTGTTRLADARLADARLGLVNEPCVAGTLAPGQTVICDRVHSYSLTQADVDAGAIDNTATAAATPPSGTTPTDSSSTVTTLDNIATIALTKQAGDVVDANGSGRRDAGDTITYTFIVTNLSNVNLSGVTVDDSRIGVTGLVCGTGALAPHASVTCQSPPYALTQNDLDAARVDNTASVAGTDPAGRSTTAQAATSVDLAPAAGLTLDKKASAPTTSGGTSSTAVDAGDTVTFGFTVTNTGAQTLSLLSIADSRLGLTALRCAATLSPGQAVTCDAVHTLTQDDIDAGRIDNTALAAARTPQGKEVTGQDSASVTFPSDNRLSLTKTASAVQDRNGNGADAGDTIDYAFAVRNDGSSTLSAVRISDPLLGLSDAPCLTGTLAPGASAQCTGTHTYTLTQADVDAGSVVNTATAAATPPTGTAPTASSTTSTPISTVALIRLDKTPGPVVDANGTGRQDAGDTVAYGFRVTNLSNVTLRQVSVSDPLVGTVTCTAATVPARSSVSCSAAAYTLRQADIDAGRVDNTAVVTALDPSGTNVSDRASAAVDLTPASRITFEKTAAAVADRNASGRVDAGDTVTYTFRVTNTGGTTLQSVRVQDARLGIPDLLCSATPLPPGGTTSCTAVHTLTQGDVDRGVVDNTATATGTPSVGDPATATASASAPVSAASSVALDKRSGAVRDVDGDGRVSPGDTIDYTFTGTNTGATTLTDLRITDSRLGLAGVLCALGPVPPGESVTCQAPTPYAVTAADIDAGQVVNTASLTATTPAGATVSAIDAETRPLDRVAQIRLLKTAGAVTDANGDGRTSAGDTVTYQFSVQNTSNVTLTGVAVTDPLLGAVTCETSVLAAGASTACAGPRYVLTQVDVDDGRVDNTATATATSSVGPVSGNDTARVDLVGSDAVSLLKTAGAIDDTDANGVDAGDRVVYTFSVTNTGSTTVHAVLIADPLLNLAGYACGSGPLAPGAMRTCTSPAYVLTQADVDRGAVDNTATATVTAPTGRTVSATGATTLPVDGAGRLDLLKSAGTLVDTNASGRQDAGDTVTYTFDITNAGAMSLAAVTLTDTKLGVAGTLCGTATLAPGATTRCTHDYVLTQGDVDAGRVDNTATASGRDRRGRAATGAGSATVSISPTSAVELTKAASEPADRDGDGRASVGDEITYTFSARNTGATTLGSFTVDDTRLGLTGLACAGGPVPPGASVRCATTAVYRLVQGDLDAGAVANTATVSAVPAVGPTVSADSSTVTSLTTVAAVSLTKTAGAVVDVNASGRQDAGDTVTYAFVVTNTSNVTLTRVAVTDAKLGAVTCPATPLGPRASVTCTAPAYPLTQADLDLGRVDNTATVAATLPNGQTTTSSATATTVLSPVAGMTLVKSASPVADTNADHRQDAGDTITYTFRVTNTGTVTLAGVTVDDARLGLAGLACGPGDLAPGASVTCSAAYRLTLADLDAGSVTNDANASGTSPTGGAASARDAVTTALTPSPAVSLVKRATLLGGDGDARADVGETISYDFTVTNTGTVSLSAVGVNDPLLGGQVACVATVLAPGASTVCGPVAHVVTREEVLAGSVTNEATARGTPPTGPAVADTARAVVPADATPAVGLIKSAALSDANSNGLADAGETITYSFDVVNTGLAPLTDMRISDARLGLDRAVCVPGPLAPGATAACTPLTTAHVVTVAEAGTGQLRNTATVTAVAAGTVTLVVSAEDSVTTPTQPGPTTPPTQPGPTTPPTQPGPTTPPTQPGPTTPPAASPARGVGSGDRGLLPSTGSTALDTVVLAGLLVLVGGVLMILRRRGRRDRTT